MSEQLMRYAQLTFNFRRVARPGKKLGRPRSDTSGVSHEKRARVTRHVPMHITMKWRPGLPTLRDEAVHELVLAAIARVNDKGGVRIVEFSIQRDHLHMIVEADDGATLTARMRGLAVSLARRLNRLWNRSGSVFADRYHRVDLECPLQVKNALRYVLQNARRHGVLFPGDFDPYSSARWFTGWREREFRRTSRHHAGCPVAEPQCWLLRYGWWERHGRLSVDEQPAAA